MAANAGLWIPEASAGVSGLGSAVGTSFSVGELGPRTVGLGAAASDAASAAGGNPWGPMAGDLGISVGVLGGLLGDSGHGVLAAAACAWRSRCFLSAAAVAACTALSSPWSCALMAGCDSAMGVGGIACVGEELTVMAP